MTFTDPLSPVPASPSGRLPGLDILRGIAALCVLALHVEWIFGLQPRAFAKGYLAVDLFFMLSGYVMARTYEPRLARGLTATAFLWARYRRLWPVMAIGSLIGLPKLLIDSPDLAAFSLAGGLNLLLLPLPAKDLAFPLNIPAWSIFLELTANLIHAAVLWRLGGRRLLMVVAIVLPLTVWAGMTHGDLDFGAHTEDYFFGVPRVLLSYVIGMMLWRWWKDTPPIAVPPILAFLLLPAALVLARHFAVGGWLFDIAFIALFCPLLIIGGLRHGPRERPGWSLAAALGALSFPLYAVHMPVLQGMSLLGFGWLGGALAAAAAGIVVTLAVEALGQQRKRVRMTA
ncbi:MAG: acyltransferase [Novosphingobium sp.]